MEKPLETLVDSLLYEGYALYPYTPGATKNATPDAVRDRLPARRTPRPTPRRSTTCGRSACSRRRSRPKLTGTVRFLQASGDRHQGAERRLELPPTTLAELAEDGRRDDLFEFEGDERIEGRVQAARRAPRRRPGAGPHVRPQLHRRSTPAADLDPRRGAALQPDLDAGRGRDLGRALRLAARARRRGRRARSAACESVNTFPVLANPSDTAILGAAFVLPDHPGDGSGEPGQPVRQHRDRGGAAAPRPRASATTSASRSRSRTRRCAR